jgi:ribonuclease HI
MKKRPKYYVVWKGRQIGVFLSWEECSAQVNGYAGAQYKSFESREMAEDAFRTDYIPGKTKQVAHPSPARLIAAGSPILPSYAVDAACSGSSGPLEYRCVYTESGVEVFRQGPFAAGTNNIGEFLAIVHALALFKKTGIDLPIYSDSHNAIIWVQMKRCNTRLQPVEANQRIFDLIDRALDWLHRNDYPNQILKWQTDVWGEIPADFGRK